MLIAFEALPRSTKALRSVVATTAAFPLINVINAPDLLQFPIRSWEACGLLAGELPSMTYIPHIRAIDFDITQPFPLTGFFRAQGINHALIIAGDPPSGNKRINRTIYPTDTVSFIRKIKTEMPELIIYAAFDPYRSNIRYEIDYLRAKEDAGAEGFMSQPFFDIRLLEIYAEYLEGKQIFWGLSPVLSESSRAYWETRNRAIFPKNFCPHMEWNIDFGRKVLDFCTSRRFHLYLMPIKVDAETYLTGLFKG